MTHVVYIHVPDEYLKFKIMPSKETKKILLSKIVVKNVINDA